VRISREKLLTQAELTGFRAEILEKVIYLLSLLEALNSHPFLKGRLALKGGTALNLFIFPLPRLSVDIDLNYIGAADRESMLSDRPKVEEAISAVCQREGLAVRHIPKDHAGGKWQLRYQSALGLGGNLEIDLNFMFRVPLWQVVMRDSQAIGSFKAKRIPVLDIHELAAGKLVALLARHASRDLFDAHQLLTHGQLDAKRLRLAFVVYGAMNRKDWRKVSVKDIKPDADELDRYLVPLLQGGSLEGVGMPSRWAKRLAAECRKSLRMVLPLNKSEREFLDELLDNGEIVPQLLTEDRNLAKRISEHPALAWKGFNVRQLKEK
jgi:predicted nucleotidyltransferase component of viral defense system